MRKVCLSPCFKNKMSGLAKGTWQVILGVLAVTLVMVVAFTIFGLIGWGLSFIWETIEVRDYIPTGFFFVVSLGVVALMLYWAYLFYKWFTSKTFKLIQERYERSYESCSIFEYCDEIEEKEEEK